MKDDPRQWPKLSESLEHPRNSTTCQSCGKTATAAEWNGMLQCWREHDHQDAPTGVVVMLCPRCAGSLIEPHARLYSREPANKPVPGAMPHLCPGCPHHDGALACGHPLLKANGGPGLNMAVVQPLRGFADGTDKHGRRTGWRIEIWPSPASACSGREA